MKNYSNMQGGRSRNLSSFLLKKGRNKWQIKRMFSLKIVDSDLFLDMPLSSQCLYFHLSMRQMMTALWIIQRR